jgi:hypothetical protein
MLSNEKLNAKLTGISSNELLSTKENIQQRFSLLSRASS